MKHVLTVRWWNVNGRWNIADKNFMRNTDILFISESHGSCLAMPEIEGFKIIGDTKISNYIKAWWQCGLHKK